MVVIAVQSQQRQLVLGRKHNTLCLRKPTVSIRLHLLGKVSGRKMERLKSLGH